MDQQSQLAVILGSDPVPFETLISHLMSSSNEQRSHAEALFNVCKQSDPDALCLRLAHLLQVCAQPDTRAMAAILLRKLLTRDDSYIWPRLNVSTHSSIKSVLLNQIQVETAQSLSKKLCDTVSELASSILPENGWPELLPFMFQCVSSDSPRLQESAFLIFAQLSQYIGDVLTPFIKDLHTVFLKCLSGNSNADVKIAALNAVINFIQCLTSSSDRDRFQDLLPAMMKTLTEALNNGNEATAQEALELLIELAEMEPRFLRRQIVDVVGSMLQIAEAESLEEGILHLAIEFVVTFAEARERAPGMMRKLPQFISRLFAILLRLLLDIEDDAAWHTAEVEDEDAGENSNYAVGQEYLDRLAISLGGNTIVPVASEQFSTYLAALEWQKHHAALIALAQIAEGCSKVMVKNLEQVVSMVLNSFNHSHPRVRWAAINAIGQLSTDLGPDLQNQYHQRVLPALAAAMDDFQNPRVQAHAASAVLNFSENCTPEILAPYLDGIVSKLLVLLQNGKQMVQEGALTALASVADSSQEHFQKYYDAVMPYLKAILVNATDKSNCMLRAESMECINLVGMAVGKEKFRADAKQVMEVLMSLQGSQMETDDPTTSYMLQAWARLCKCLGQDFLPYMTVVIPPLLQSAQLKPDVTITSADSDNDIEDSDDESEEEAKKRIYSVCTTRYTGFRAFFSVDLIDELRELPRVRWVLPVWYCSRDHYYAGDIFVDGKVLHRPQFPWVGGCGDDELWLITFEFRGEPSLEEKIDFYVKTLAYVVGSEEEAKRRIYAVGGGLTRYTGFRAVLSEGMAYELQGLPLVEGVYRVEEYNEDVDGGHLLVDGKVVLRPASFGQKRPKVGRLADLLHFLQDQMLDVIYGEETKSNSGGKNRSRASIRLFRYLYL